MSKAFFFLAILLTIFSCKKIDAPIPPDQLSVPYFPSNNNWTTLSPDSLSWDATEIENLQTLLNDNGTRAFIILVKGRIVLEEYFGKNLLGLLPFGKNTKWYWASAGKTLTGFTVGKAQEEGYLEFSDPTKQYLGQNWTALSPDQEDNITILHQLTMTTGLDDAHGQNNDISPENLIFKAPPSSRWAYHSAPYTLLQDVVSEATNQEFTTYFQSTLADKIGMNGDWKWVGGNHLYFSTARAMARFGLLMQNDGVWKEERLLNESFVTNQKTPSQTINNSYGYLWWLNGKTSYMLPSTQTVFQGSLIPNAPDDMYCGLGANGQYLCIIPSKDMVIIRMGEDPDNSLAPINFLNEIWEVLNQMM